MNPATQAVTAEEIRTFLSVYIFTDASLRKALEQFANNRESDYSLIGLGKGNGATTNIDQGVPVAASGAQEKASSVVNVGRDGAKHDFETAAFALPHGCAPVDGGNSTTGEAA